MLPKYTLKILETCERSEYGSSFDQTFRKSLKEKQSAVPYLLIVASILMLFEILYIKRRGDV